MLFNSLATNRISIYRAYLYWSGNIGFGRAL